MMLTMALRVLSYQGPLNQRSPVARTPTPYRHYLMNPKIYLVRKKLGYIPLMQR